MKHFLLIILVISLLLPDATFAGDTIPRSLKDIGKSIQSLNTQKNNLQERWGKFFDENGNIQEFLKPNLSETELASIADMISAYSKQKIKLEDELSQVSKDGGNTDDIKKSILELKINLYKQFIPYIQVEKYDDYKKFIEGNIAIVKTDKELKEELYKEQELYYKKIDSLKEKIEANKKALDESIRLAVEQRIDEKIASITQNPDFISLSLGSKLSIFENVLEKVKKRKETLASIRDKTTLLEKKIEIFQLFEDKIQEIILKLQQTPAS